MSTDNALNPEPASSAGPATSLPSPAPSASAATSCEPPPESRWVLFFRRVEGELERLARYPLATIQIALLLLIGCGIVGSGLGAGDLFWHEYASNQFFMGWATAWLFGTILFVTLLLLPPRRLPGALPEDSALCGWRWLTMFPSNDLGVRSIGRRILVWLVVLLVVVYAGNAVVKFTHGPESDARSACLDEPAQQLGSAPQTRESANDMPQRASEARTAIWVDFQTRNYGLPFVAGYVFALIFCGVISFTAHRTGLREWIACGGWLIRGFEGANPRIPTDPQLTPHPQCGRSMYFQELEALHPAASDTLGPDERRARFAQFQPHESAALCNRRTILHLHAMAAVLAALTTVTFLLALTPTFGGAPTWVGPGALVALLLVLLNVLFGWAAFRWRYTRLVVCALALVYLLIHTRVQPTQMTFDGIGWKPEHQTSKAAYANKLKLPATAEESDDVGPQPAGGLISTAQLLETFGNKYGTTERKPRLVLIATSGGGIRAAVWTGVVLEGLERELGIQENGSPAIPFRNHTRIITGASGGMVGATAYASREPEGPYSQPKAKATTPSADGLLPLSELLARDSLSPVVQTMLVRDFTTSALVPRTYETDRGRTLEDAWNRNFTKPQRRDEAGNFDGKLFERCPFARSLRELRVREETCERPSLIFAPIMVEDTKRLLISNLDLAHLTQPEAYRLDAPRGPKVAKLSQPAVEFFRWFPYSDTFSVGSAARMSASFPVVSPAVPLPTCPPRRVVDAGYYDNYGIDILSNWLLANKRDVVAHTSGVLIIQIRAYPLEVSGAKFRHESASLMDVFIGSVSAPLSAVFTARGSAAYHRNNQQLAELERAFNTSGSHAKARSDFFATTVFELQQDAALSWYLTTAQKRQVAEGFYKYNPAAGAFELHPDQTKRPGEFAVTSKVDGQIKAIREWFRDK